MREAGDLVQADTMDMRPLPGVVFKDFMARKTVSRWDVVQAHPRATAKAATQFADPDAVQGEGDPGRWAKRV